MAESPVTFAGLLRKLCAEARLTQEELAEASGVRPRSISDLERGVAVSPQRETIRRLADALNLPGWSEHSSRRLHGAVPSLPLPKLQESAGPQQRPGRCLAA